MNKSDKLKYFLIQVPGEMLNGLRPTDFDLLLPRVAIGALIIF